MPFRRKLPQRRPSSRRPLSPASIIQREIDQLDQQEAILAFELEDMFADVDTPTSSDQETASDNEDHEVFPSTVYGPHTFYSAHLQAEMLSAIAIPENVSYDSLYTQDLYKKNCLRKMKKMKRLISRTNFDQINHKSMWKSINRVKKTYPKNGGRRNLAELIGLYCLLDVDNNLPDYSDTDSEADISFSDNDDITSEDDNNDDNDDDHAAGPQLPANQEIGIAA